MKATILEGLKRLKGSKELAVARDIDKGIDRYGKVISILELKDEIIVSLGDPLFRIRTITVWRREEESNETS